MFLLWSPGHFAPTCTAKVQISEAIAKHCTQSFSIKCRNKLLNYSSQNLSDFPSKSLAGKLSDKEVKLRQMIT